MAARPRSVRCNRTSHAADPGALASSTFASLLRSTPRLRASFSGAPGPLILDVPAAVYFTHGASLMPLRAIVPQPGNGSWLRQSGTRLRPSFPRPWLPAPGAVGDAVVSDGPEHHID